MAEECAESETCGALRPFPSRTAKSTYGRGGSGRLLMMLTLVAAQS